MWEVYKEKEEEKMCHPRRMPNETERQLAFIVGLLFAMIVLIGIIIALIWWWL